MARFRFHGKLTELPGVVAGMEHQVAEGQTVKACVEALGVPHVEVGTVEANGTAADLSRLVDPGDVVDVHPAKQAAARFALDGHLGRLARYLRLVGLDVTHRQGIDDAEVVALAVAEARTVLTRDRELLMRKALTSGYWVRNTEPRLQLREVVSRFGLEDRLAPFTRCMACNGLLEDVDKEKIAHRLEPGTRRSYDAFRRCTSCGQVFWAGAHFDRLLRIVETART
jgi:uncharacterized protein